MKRTLGLCSLLVLSFGLSNSEALATTRRVPADFPTIQQAINAAVNGDTVLVAAGTYVENINFLGKAITLTSESGPQVTIIDGGQLNSAVRFISGEARSSILSGFTIQNGASGFFGGGVRITGSSPSIIGNIITNNSAGAGHGIAVGVASSLPLIQGNIITGNFMTPFGSGGPGGGGILVSDSGRAEIIGNEISGNSIGNGAGGGGISIFGGGSTLILGNKIINNAAGPGCCGTVCGGGIYVNTFTHQFIIQNLVINNHAQDEGGGIWGNDFTLINNTIANNDAPVGSGLFMQSFSPLNACFNNIIVAKPGQVAFFCLASGLDSFGAFKSNNVFSPGGMAYGGTFPAQTGVNGNISADPLFVNPAAGDYHLKAASPSIDTGDNSAPDLPPTDLDARPRIRDGNGDGVAIVDMGAYEFFIPFDTCIQDDSSGSILQVNTTTGEYQFTNCSGFTISGTGGLIKRGSTITLQHTASDRRVMVKIEGGLNKATASIQVLSQGLSFTITDRNTTNNTCSCK